MIIARVSDCAGNRHHVKGSSKNELVQANNLPDECSKFKAANIARTAKRSWGEELERIISLGMR